MKYLVLYLRLHVCDLYVDTYEADKRNNRRSK
jgi:hypothetical protein